MTIDPIGYRPPPHINYDFHLECHGFNSDKHIQERQQKKYYSDTLAPFIASSVAANVPDSPVTTKA
ncbi:MAG TPA: hypothetical protein VIH61_03825, partial [Waddliaceae bacterium]